MTDHECYTCKGKGGPFFDGDSFSHRRSYFPPCYGCGKIRFGRFGTFLHYAIMTMWTVVFVVVGLAVLWSLGMAKVYEDCREERTKEQCEHLL